MLEIHTLDADYIYQGVACVYLLTSQGHACLIDSGSNHSIPIIEKALVEKNILANHVDFIILTHIHLDHAGGASQLMQLFPKAKLIVHPFGSKHMINPSKLIAGTKAVYGDRYNELYGEIIPIDADRVIETHDGMTVNFQNEELLIINTPGHASHHNCILHHASQSCFTGDTFGLCYPHLSDVSEKPLIPTTTPVQFSPEKLIDSVDKVMSFNPSFLYPTHFGKYTIHSLSIVQFKERIRSYCLLAEKYWNEDKSDQLESELLDYMTSQIEYSSDKTRDWLRMDAKLNAQGLNVWLEKKYSK